MRHPVFFSSVQSWRALYIRVPRLGFAAGVALCVLSVAAHAQERAILQNKFPVFALSLSLDSKWLAVAYDDAPDAVKIWDVAKVEEVPLNLSFAKAATSVTFSPDGKTLAAAGPADRPRIYDATKFKSFQLIGEVGTKTLAFFPDSKTLATGTDNSVILWGVLKGERIADLTSDVKSIRALAVSPDGKNLAAGGYGNAVLWELPSGKVRSYLAGHQRQVNCVAFSPDNKTLVTVERYLTKSKVYLWNSQTGQRKREIDTSTGYAQVCAAAFSPDSKTLAVVGKGTIHLWDVESGKHRAELKVHMHFEATCVAFSPDGRTLAVGHEDCAVRLYDVPNDR